MPSKYYEQINYYLLFTKQASNQGGGAGTEKFTRQLQLSKTLVLVLVS